MGTSQNTRYGSRPRTHTRSIPPDPYLDPYPVVLHDPYPWSIPLSHWRKTDAGPNAAFYPNTASGPRTATPVATPVAATVATTVATTGATIVATAASAASAASVLLLLLLLLLLPLLVIFLPGAAATAVASVAAPAGPALAAGAGSLPPCASGSWTNATSWVATTNIASAPWRLVRPVLVPLGASCTSSGAMFTTPSVSALPGTCRTRLDLEYPALFFHSHSVKAGLYSVSRSIPRSIPVPYPIHTRTQSRHNEWMPIWKSDSITTSTAAAAATTTTTTTTTPTPTPTPPPPPAAAAAAAIPTPLTTPSTTATATAATTIIRLLIFLLLWLLLVLLLLLLLFLLLLHLLLLLPLTTAAGAVFFSLLPRQAVVTGLAATVQEEK